MCSNFLTKRILKHNTTGMRFSNTLIFLIVSVIRETQGHGRLSEPPSRSSMWRFGFNTPHNYDDNQLFCGGFSVQWGSNGGKCGICGDNYAGPRENEAGGKYATGIITRHYTEGETIHVAVDVTANHKGWFEFKLCPNNDVKKAPDQNCFDQYLLKDTAQTSRFYIDTLVGMKQFDLVLPAGLTCTQCILQWKWNTGNSWGTDLRTGKACIGCGPQEQFYGCSDVAIQPANNSNLSKTKTTTKTTTTQPTTTTTRATTTTTQPTTTTAQPTTTTTLPTTTTTQPTTTTTQPTTTTTQPTTTTKQPTTTTTQPTTTTTQPTTTTTQPTTTTTQPTTTTTQPTTTTARLTTTTTQPTTTTTRSTTATTLGTTATKQPTTKVTASKTTSSTIGNGSKNQHRIHVCKGAGLYKKVRGMAWWCQINCDGGFCPKSHCACT